MSNTYLIKPYKDYKEQTYFSMNDNFEKIAISRKKDF